MDVNSFLGALKTEVAGESREEPVSPPAPVASIVTCDVTPSGIEVKYQAQPKRLYWVNGEVVPSVTTVLDVLAKGGLTIWGMRVGIKGVLALIDSGHLSTAFDWDTDRERVVVVGDDKAVNAGYADDALVEALMKEHSLTTDKAKDQAADRGNIVHNALEKWAKTGEIPKPDDFDEREQGYVKGIAAFLTDADPEPVRTEVMVASAEHGFAGRYDLELRFKETKRVRLTPKQKWQEIAPGTFLTDCKSAKAVYPDSNFRQLAAYEGARIESGYPATDAQYVLNVNGEGSYAFVKSTAVLADYLEVLAVYHGNRRLKKAA